MAQVVESSTSIAMRGKAITFQGRIRPNGSSFLSYAVGMCAWTGTADSVTKDFVNLCDVSYPFTPGNFYVASNISAVANSVLTDKSASWQSFSISGTIPNTCNNIIVFLVVQNYSTSEVKLAECDLHIGSFARTWQPRPYAQELALCQRYYEKSGLIDVPVTAPPPATNYIALTVALNTIPNAYRYATIPFAVSKRAIPTITVRDFADPSLTERVSTSTGTTLGANSGKLSHSGINYFTLYNNTGSNMVTTNNFILFEYSADAEL